MADAAGTWTAATLSTVASITKFEGEISQLQSIGDTSYSVTAGNVATTITPVSLDVSDGKKSLEIIGIAATQCVFSGFAVTVTESDDDETFTAYGTGLILFSKAGTVAAGSTLFKWVIPSDFADYFKPAITKGSSTGTISIYANSIWAGKIALAKSIIGTDLSLLLNNNMIRDNLADDDDVLDCIYNPAVLGLASDFKVLELIYKDLARGAEIPSLYWSKGKAYEEAYREYLQKQVKLLTVDINQDQTNLVYYSDLNFVAQAGR